MSLLGFLFNNPVGPFCNPFSPLNLRDERSRRSTVGSRRTVSRNAKRRNEQDALRTAVARLLLAVETARRRPLRKGICTNVESQELPGAIDLGDGGADGRMKR
jgi:hypothetical protein